MKPRLDPADVERIIQQSVLAHFAVIPLGVDDYREAMKLSAKQSLSSDAISDALHPCGARSAGCGKLLTLNLRRFISLAPGDSIIASPQAEWKVGPVGTYAE